jgi:hypothetical protein
MKKSILYIVLVFATIIFSGCEKVIDVDLNNAEPKLVIDAVIKWQKGTTGEEQVIKLSLTNDFFTNEILPANGASVTITNSVDETFTFLEDGTTGNYICSNFNPVIGEIYTLVVIYDGEIYTATNPLMATPPIINIQQETVPGFGGDDQIQIKFFYQDNGAEDNYYLLGVKNPNKQIPEFGVVSDEFFQGNIMFGFYGSSETEPGITLKLSVQGITFGFHNYMNILTTIGGSGSGNPFATPPATLRGNIVNQTNSNNFPLGYFHLSEIDEVDYLVQ